MFEFGLYFVEVGKLHMFCEIGFVHVSGFGWCFLVVCSGSDAVQVVCFKVVLRPR